MDSTSWDFRAGASLLTPNLIDLSLGANRLRLKPVVELGAAYAVRTNEQMLFENKTDLEWWFNVDYYIPVSDRYAIIFEAEGRYNQNVTQGSKWRYWNAVTFSYDLPVEDLKALFKWETGRTAYVTDSGSRLLLGILVNQIPL